MKSYAETNPADVYPPTKGSLFEYGAIFVMPLLWNFLSEHSLDQARRDAVA